MTARIMVADGAATARITLKVRLAAVRHDVTAFATATQMIARIEASLPDRPDLIVLGNDLPDARAVDLCRSLTRDPRLSDLPVLMLVRAEGRVAALEAGAAATLEPGADDQMLMARIRNLLRRTDLPIGSDRMGDARMGMAEAPAGFQHDQPPVVVLVADHPGRAQMWRQMLSPRMRCRFRISDADEALGAEAEGQRADLYLISADLRARGDGLRLLSELRSRQGSRDAGFVIALAPDRAELSAIALDLGAGDVVVDAIASPALAQAAAMSLQAMLSRKSRTDQRRAEVQRHMVWAMTDPLTGLHNRRFAQPRLAQIASDAAMTQATFAVFAVDLDLFKQVNDQHGHAAGDAVLVDLAQRLRSTFGPGALVARMGGEEFLGVIEDCAPDHAMILAEALRHRIADRPVLLPGGGRIRVTASVGVAMVSGADCGWPEEGARLALERADQALRAAKTAGRNRVVRARPIHAA